MFTGIVESTGQIVKKSDSSHGQRITVECAGMNLRDLRVGESVALSGVCLTVVMYRDTQLDFDVSNETVRRTTLGQMEVGAPVNLERAVTPATRLGGHFVSGHVDDVAQVLERRDGGNGFELQLQIPHRLMKYIAEKGSLCVDGVSLTVNTVYQDQAELFIIPHTAGQTTLGALRAGTRVNIEVDIVARYLERLLSAGQDSSANNITRTMLANHGFIKNQV